MSKYDNILNLIYQLESSSGKNRAAYKPNKAGALGGYQITPGTFEDLQIEMPEKYGKKSFQQVVLNDETAREAAGDIVKIKTKRMLRKNIAPTRDALLAAYHSGVKGMMNLGPAGRQYLQRAKALAGLGPEYTARR